MTYKAGLKQTGYYEFYLPALELEAGGIYELRHMAYKDSDERYTEIVYVIHRLEE